MCVCTSMCFGTDRKSACVLCHIEDGLPHLFTCTTIGRLARYLEKLGSRHQRVFCLRQQRPSNGYFHPSGVCYRVSVGAWLGSSVGMIPSSDRVKRLTSCIRLQEGGACPEGSPREWSWATDAKVSGVRGGGAREGGAQPGVVMVWRRSWDLPIPPSHRPNDGRHGLA